LTGRAINIKVVHSGSGVVQHINTTAHYLVILEFNC